ncbi:MAG: DUF6359 domain-containing protein [Candidatus Cryptobacteroides sp.]
MSGQFKLQFIIAALAAAAILPACDFNETEGQGTLRLHFSEMSYDVTKAASDIPDTSEFLLTVTDSGGKTVYSGKFGDSPESILVNAGTYDISVRSGVFKAPAFSSPLFGDDQCVTVRQGAVSDVVLTCSQMNSGVRLKTDEAFLKAFPDGSLFLSSDEGQLMYSYSEKRTAYFNPGNVSLILKETGGNTTLLTRPLGAREILTITVSVPNISGSGSINIQLDTTRNHTGETVTIGGNPASGKGDDLSTALNVSEAPGAVGSTGVWVYGYIVGGDLSSSSVSFTPPFKSETNLAIAARTSVTEKSSCLSVQLPQGEIRNALNLVSNPSNLKRKLWVKGDIVAAYFGIPGIKNIKEYHIE